MDFKILSDAGLNGELAFEKSDDITTAIYTSLNTNRGEFFQRPDFGSRLNEIKNTTEKSLNLAKEFIKSALQWLVDVGRARSISVFVERDFTNPNRMNFKIEAVQADGVLIEYETFKRVV